MPSYRLPIFRDDGRLRQQYIYLLVCRDTGGAHFVKIGRTVNPDRRLSEILTGCPVEALTFYFTPIEAQQKIVQIERGLHRALSDSRVRREWFRCDGPEPLKDATFMKCVRKAFYLSGVYEAQWSAIDVRAHQTEMLRRVQVYRGNKNHPLRRAAKAAQSRLFAKRSPSDAAEAAAARAYLLRLREQT